MTMSNETIIMIRDRIVSDFIVVEHGTTHLTLSLFIGSEKSASLLLTKEQAEKLSIELADREAARNRRTIAGGKDGKEKP